MQENALLSVIVPCYNEADNLPLFYQHILQVCRPLCEQGSISDYEILLVNDGSKDRTLPTMRALSEQDPHVFFLSFTRNFGKEAAMLAGLSHSRGDFVTIMDADLQDPPELLPEMFSVLHNGEGNECVATRRSSRKESRRCVLFLPISFIGSSTSSPMSRSFPVHATSG